MRDFVGLLQLPINERGRRASAEHAEWFATTPLDNVAILADEALKRTGAPQETRQDCGRGEAASDTSTSAG